MSNVTASHIAAATVAELFWRTFGVAAEVVAPSAAVRSVGDSSGALIWCAPDSTAACLQIAGRASDAMLERALSAWAAMAIGNEGVAVRAEQFATVFETDETRSCWSARSGGALLALRADNEWWSRLVEPEPASGVSIQLDVWIGRAVAGLVVCDAEGLPCRVRWPAHERAGRIVVDGGVRVLWDGSRPPVIDRVARFAATVHGHGHGSIDLQIAATGALVQGDEPVGGAAWVTDGQRVALRLRPRSDEGSTGASRTPSEPELSGVGRPGDDPALATESAEDDRTQTLSRDDLLRLLGRNSAS